MRALEEHDNYDQWSPERGTQKGRETESSPLGRVSTQLQEPEHAFRRHLFPRRAGVVGAVSYVPITTPLRPTLAVVPSIRKFVVPAKTTIMTSAVKACTCTPLQRLRPTEHVAQARASRPAHPTTSHTRWPRRARGSRVKRRRTKAPPRALAQSRAAPPCAPRSPPPPRAHPCAAFLPAPAAAPLP